MKKEIYRIGILLINSDAKEAEELHKKSKIPHTKVYMRGVKAYAEEQRKA